MEVVLAEMGFNFIPRVVRGLAWYQESRREMGNEHCLLQVLTPRDAPLLLGLGMAGWRFSLRPYQYCGEFGLYGSHLVGTCGVGLDER